MTRIQSPKRMHSAGKPGGFTLLEVLIAIALIAAVAALLITNLDRILGGGNREVARIFVNETMETPLMTYRVHMGGYPTTEEGLAVLVNKPSEDATNWQGPYVKKEIPLDPWGMPYQYRYPGEKNPGSYDLWSYGPDKEESEDDIGNWPADSGDSIGDTQPAPAAP